jgi:hypothetical protein
MLKGRHRRPGLTRKGPRPSQTLRVHAQAVKRRDHLSKPHQKEYDAASEWAATGSKEPLTVPVMETVER